jgi:capsular polysaccharide biosynthesis protein
MELREYWRVFKRRAWIPILLLVVTVLTAGALAFVSKPEYTATVTVTAKAQGTSTTSQVLSFQEVATSTSVAEQVIKKLDLNTNVAQFKKRVKVSAGRSNLYKVSITDPDPQRAASLANAIGEGSATLYPKLNASTGITLYDQEVKAARVEFQKRYLEAAKALVAFNRQNPNAIQSPNLDVQAQAMDLKLREQAAAAAYTDFETQTTTDTVHQLAQATSFGAAVVDPAAAAPDATSRYLKVAYAAALALILGLGLIFVLEYLDNAIRDPEGVEEMVGAPVVAIVPRATAQTLRPAQGGAS